KLRALVSAFIVTKELDAATEKHKQSMKYLYTVALSYHGNDCLLQDTKSTVEMAKEEKKALTKKMLIAVIRGDFKSFKKYFESFEELIYRTQHQNYAPDLGDAITVYDILAKHDSMVNLLGSLSYKNIFSDDNNPAHLNFNTCMDFADIDIESHFKEKNIVDKNIAWDDQSPEDKRKIDAFISRAILYQTRSLKAHRRRLENEVDEYRGEYFKEIYAEAAFPMNIFLFLKYWFVTPEGDSEAIRLLCSSLDKLEKVVEDLKSLQQSRGSYYGF
ncbi:MAG: hypothetical protein HON55_04790, partial [Legionellales bacterium]|nr:hypothetical protein [Legionellales bacterium]